MIKNFHKLSRIALFLTVGILISFNASLSLEKIQSQQSLSTSAFLDSIGVAVHLSYLETSYGKYHEIIKPRLQELGVHHIRDGLRVEDLKTRDKFNDLGKLGIKSTLVMDPRDINIASNALKVAKLVPNSIEAVEGPNEWDVHPELEYKGKNFPEGIRQFQAELYTAIKSDPDTSHLPVLSPSIAYPQNAAQLAQVDCDLGNMHSYTLSSWGMPMGGLEDQWIPAANAVCSDKPIIATETGYHNAVMSEEAASKYLLRLFLEYFNHGIRRTYSYELIDLKANPERDYDQYNFGLLRYDGSPKPDFIALKNLIFLLQESEPIASNSLSFKRLEYNLQGNKTNIHHTLLQKSDGKLYLILWQEVPSFDLSNRTDIVVPERPLTLTLNRPIRQATTYQPVNSITPIEQYDKTNQFKLSVPDHPLIIELISD
jgi:hypothetical protein